MPSKLVRLQNRPRDPFELYLRDYRRDLVVPEQDITMLGHGTSGWTPEHETPTAGPCLRCGGTRIDPDSGFYCPKCTQSGYEEPLAEQRRIAPKIRREPKPRTPKPERASKKTRKRVAKGTDS